MGIIINVTFIILAFAMLITTIWANIKQIQTHVKLDKKIDDMDTQKDESAELIYPPGTGE